MTRPERTNPPRLAALTLLASLAAPLGALGQTFPGDTRGGDPRQDRYERAKKGASLDEWVRRLDDDDAATRLEAVKSLGESGDPEAVDYLMQAAGDPDPRVQAKAVDYLGETSATGATTFLIQRLSMSGTPAPLRHRILMALGKIRDARASRPILEFLSRDVSPNVRGTGIYALGEIGDPEIFEELDGLRERERNPRLVGLIDDALAKIAARRDQPTNELRIFPSALEAALQKPPPEG